MFLPIPALTTSQDIADQYFGMLTGGVTDSDLLRILAILEIDNIVVREGGWDVTREWREAISGGDQQRIAMARLFYHCPKVRLISYFKG